MTKTRKRHLIQDTRGSINDGAATLRNEWRSLHEEGPPHVNSDSIELGITSCYLGLRLTHR